MALAQLLTAAEFNNRVLLFLTAQSAVINAQAFVGYRDCRKVDIRLISVKLVMERFGVRSKASSS